ncbi:MAG: DNA/RNA non-specific endonuclease [Bacteriovoracia bacterium]
MHQGWLRISRTFALALLLAAGNAAAGSPTPIVPEGSFALKKTALTLSYNPSYKQSDWVFYSLGPDQLQDCYDRPSNFRPDPQVPRGQSAQLSDYKGSGLDRGHLSPAGDNKWSDDAMNESFLLSNISPQPPKFNRGLWSRLESLVRAWAMRTGGLWVTTGPVLQGGLDSIGGGNVAVPKYFYKVLATQTGQAMALLIPTDADQLSASYAMPVDQLEAFARLDFLHGMKNEDAVEARVDLAKWDFKAKFEYAPCQARSMAGWFQAPPRSLSQ